MVDQRAVSSSAAPLVSLVLITHRQNPYFEAQLESIWNQTWTDWELIVVDDGWDDPDLLRKIVGTHPSARVIGHSRRYSGVARTRNIGLGEARGEFIAFVDHDDVWEPNHLENLVTALQSDPTAAGAYSLYKVIDDTGHVIQVVDPIGPTTYEQMMSGGHRPSIVNLLTRRHLVLALGGFQYLAEPAEDLDFLFRLAAEGPFVYSPQATISYRRHPGNISGDTVRCAEAAERVLRFQESVARSRDDTRTADLLERNRAVSNQYWVGLAMLQAFQQIRGGDRKVGLRLLRWASRKPKVAATASRTALRGRAAR